MEGGSLQGKQQYLRQKIIDAGHDPQLFVEFCSSKHNLDDLENWSMHELVHIVQAFLQQIQPAATTPLHNVNEKTNTTSNTAQTALNTHPPTGNLGLVLSDDDWNILLSTPSVAAKTEEKPTQPNPVINFDLAFGLQEPLQLQVEPASKDSPLSPPSIMQKPTVLPVSLPAQEKVETKDLPVREATIRDISIKQHVRVQKKGEKKGQSTAAINLSNVVLTTAKQKPLQPLPNIQEVVVSKTEQVTRNFLQGDYTLYHITFTPCQITINRRYADLLKLRAILQRLFPFLRLPFLEAEGWLGSSEGKDPETLTKYKWMVEEFMRFVIVKSEELRMSEVVRFFCGLTKKEYSKEEFRKKLEAYQAVPRPKFLGEVVLTNNTITIPPTAPAEKLAIASCSLIGEIDVQYQRLRRQLDTLFGNYDLLIKSYSDIASTFATLQSLINRHRTEYQSPTKESSQQHRQFGAFSSLQEMVLRLSNKTSKDMEMFRTRIKNLFRYQKDNMTTLRTVIDTSNIMHSEFSRQGCPPLSTSKLKAGCMEIDSPVPLQDAIRNNKPILAVQEIFWAFAVRRESSRYWQLLRRKLNEALTLIAYDELDSENENLNFWNGIIKRCVM